MGFPQPARPQLLYRDFLPASRTGVEQSVRPSILCSHCSHIRLYLEKHLDGVRLQETSQRFTHHGTYNQLMQAYEYGCHLCTILWHSLVDKFEFTGTGAEAYYTIDLDERKQLRENNMNRISEGTDLEVLVRPSGALENCLNIQSWIMSGTTRLEGNWFLVKRYDSRPIGGDGSINLELYPQFSDFSNCLRICTASNSILGLAKLWLEDCVTSHTKCRATDGQFIPTRLLDISSAQTHGTIRLSLGTGFRLKDGYAALSYCWGGNSTAKLTKSTLRSLSVGICVQKLPKTIQDAVYITAKLGLKWLWVDALCIIQDSVEDWTREAAEMGKIYLNSFITLAALGASNSNEGLFAQRDPLMYSNCRLANGKKFWLNIEDPISKFGVGLTHKHNWPLHRRGWVVQERILAPRTLNFGPVMLWECREIGIHEFGPKHDGISRGESGTLCGNFFDKVLKVSHRPIGTLESQSIITVWEDIVARYSETSFTVRTDKIAAIMGIVSIIQAYRSWKYVHGLWQPFTLRGLCWSPIVDARRRNFERSDLGPTWSWISFNGEVFYHYQRMDFKPLAEAEVLGRPTELSLTDNSPLFNTSYVVEISCVAIKGGSKIPKTAGIRTELLETWTMPHINYNFTTQSHNTEILLPLVEWDVEWDVQGNSESRIFGIVILPSLEFPGYFERQGHFQYNTYEGGDRLMLRDLSERQIFRLI